MAEEHGFRASEGHTLCLNNCGFFGSPATQNFCSKCYTDLFINQEDVKSVKLVTVELDLPSPQVSLPSSSSSAVTSPATVTVTTTSISSSVEQAAAAAAQPNRCSSCRKKVGLTGFRCRCGITFCGTHRYPEQHGCNFDFKTIGREAIAKANPVVKGKKLDKI